MQPKIEFDEFWSLFPKKVGKKPAKKLWDRLSAEVQRTILADLPKRKLGQKWQEHTYIEHPTTYLNQERWEDEIEGVASSVFTL